MISPAGAEAIMRQGNKMGGWKKEWENGALN